MHDDGDLGEKTLGPSTPTNSKRERRPPVPAKDHETVSPTLMIVLRWTAPVQGTACVMAGMGVVVVVVIVGLGVMVVGMGVIVVGPTVGEAATSLVLSHSNMEGWHFVPLLKGLHLHPTPSTKYLHGPEPSSQTTQFPVVEGRGPEYIW